MDRYMQNNAANLNAFLTGANTALSAPITLGGAVPTPMVAVTYRGYKVSAPPNAVDATDTTESTTRLTMLRAALFHVLAAVSATTEDLTTTTTYPPALWDTWSCWLITLGHLTLAQPSQDADVVRGITEIDTAVANSLYAGLRQLKASTPPNIQVYEAVLRAASISLKLPVIGPLNAKQLAAIAGSGSPGEMASLYALQIYLMGRPFSGSAVAVSTKRTANLENKGNHKNKWASISGEAKMSLGTVRMVSLTWERDPKMRAGCFLPLIGLNMATADANLSMISTMTGLLPMSQMGHVKIVLDFVKKYPFVMEMSSLAGEWYELADSTATWNTYPARIRPYCKLLYRDQFKAFDSKKLERLIKLATDKTNDPAGTVSGYALRGAPQLLTDEFERLLTLHSPAAQVTPVASGSALAMAPTV